MLLFLRFLRFLLFWTPSDTGFIVATDIFIRNHNLPTANHLRSRVGPSADGAVLVDLGIMSFVMRVGQRLANLAAVHLVREGKGTSTAMPTKQKQKNESIVGTTFWTSRGRLGFYYLITHRIKPQPPFFFQADRQKRKKKIALPTHPAFWRGLPPAMTGWQIHFPHKAGVGMRGNSAIGRVQYRVEMAGPCVGKTTSLVRSPSRCWSSLVLRSSAAPLEIMLAGNRNPRTHNPELGGARLVTTIVCT